MGKILLSAVQGTAQSRQSIWLFSRGDGGPNSDGGKNTEVLRIYMYFVGYTYITSSGFGSIGTPLHRTEQMGWRQSVDKI
jgi:hypothetical protein